MKKIISIILSCIFCMNFVVISHAANAKLIASDTTVTAGETFEVHYGLKNNPGIMGFAVNISFDSSKIEIISVEKSSTVVGGMFDDSISDKTTDSVKIIWSGTENLDCDTELFTVIFKAKETANGKVKINACVSEEDTFNEKWETIKVENCNMSVTINNGNNQSVWAKIISFFDVIIQFVKRLFA